jgi:hypothetical protein
MTSLKTQSEQWTICLLRWNVGGQVYRLDNLQKTRELVSGGTLLRRRFR